jgi:hypothetical protein
MHSQAAPPPPQDPGRAGLLRVTAELVQVGLKRSILNKLRDRRQSAIKKAIIALLKRNDFSEILSNANGDATVI